MLKVIGVLILWSVSLGAQVPTGWKVVKSPQRLTRSASPTGNPVREGHFIIEDPAMEDIAKKVAMTVRPSK